MYFFGDAKKDLTVLGTYAGKTPYEMSTLKTAFPLDEIEVHRELARLLLEEDRAFPFLLERRYRRFEDVMFWCAVNVKIEDPELIETIFRLSLDSVAVPMIRYVLSTRRAEIEKYRSLYEEMKERYEKTKKYGVDDLTIGINDKECDNVFNYYVLDWKTNGETFRVPMLSEKIITPYDIERIVTFVIRNLKLDNAMRNDPSGKKTWENDDAIRWWILTAMAFLNTSVFGLFACTKETYVKQFDWVRRLVYQDAYGKYQEEILQKVKDHFAGLAQREAGR